MANNNSETTSTLNIYLTILTTDLHKTFGTNFMVTGSFMRLFCNIRTIGPKTNIVVINNTHYNDVMMSMMTSQITYVSIVCSTVCSGADQ